MSEGDLAADLGVLPDDSDLVASPEIFGDGWKTFRHLLFKRALADYLVSANPRVWSIVELPQPVGPSNQPSNNER